MQKTRAVHPPSTPDQKQHAVERRPSSFRRRLGLVMLALVASVAFVPFGLAATQDCPDWTQNGTSLTYSSNDLWSAKPHSVVAGGELHLTQCLSVPGIGYITQRPDFTMTFTGNGSAMRALEIRVRADCDTTLLVNDANLLWHFDDDSIGFDPRIRIDRANDGFYDIWVGTIDNQPCRAVLELESF